MRATVAGTATRNKTGGGGGHDAQGDGDGGGGDGGGGDGDGGGTVTVGGRWRGRSVFGGQLALLCDWRRGAPARFIRAIITQFADCNRQLRPANPAAVPGSRGEFKRRRPMLYRDSAARKVADTHRSTSTPLRAAAAWAVANARAETGTRCRGFCGGLPRRAHKSR